MSFEEERRFEELYPEFIGEAKLMIDSLKKCPCCNMLFHRYIESERNIKQNVREVIDKQWGKDSIDGNYQYLIKELNLND